MSTKHRGHPPRLLMCYICGREFGSQSLGIHEPQCLEKWRAEQLLLPHGQRAKHEPLRVRMDVGDGGVEAANEAARESLQANMVGCEFCGRRFSGGDRLAVHHRSCSAEKPAAAVPGFVARPSASPAALSTRPGTSGFGGGSFMSSLAGGKAESRLQTQPPWMPLPAVILSKVEVQGNP